MKVLQRTYSHEKSYEMHAKSHEEKMTDPLETHSVGLTVIEAGAIDH